MLPLALFFGVLVSMFVGLDPRRAAQAAPPQAPPLPLAAPPDRDRQAPLAPLGRFREILRFAREAWPQHYASSSKLATPEFARRLRLTLEDCGGMFVKFGQIASTRSDLLPEVLTTELSDAPVVGRVRSGADAGA